MHMFLNIYWSLNCHNKFDTYDDQFEWNLFVLSLILDIFQNLTHQPKILSIFCMNSFFSPNIARKFFILSQKLWWSYCKLEFSVFPIVAFLTKSLTCGWLVIKTRYFLNLITAECEPIVSFKKNLWSFWFEAQLLTIDQYARLKKKGFIHSTT